MGLAPMIVEEIFDIIQHLNRADGVTFLLAEQNANLVLHYADYGLVLENGRVVTSGPADDLRQSQDFMAYYFGETRQAEIPV
jgi:branched-chain amino acid transport system ATP-binding protein